METHETIQIENWEAEKTFIDFERKSDDENEWDTENTYIDYGKHSEYDVVVHSAKEKSETKTHKNTYSRIGWVVCRQILRLCSLFFVIKAVLTFVRVPFVIAAV